MLRNRFAQDLSLLTLAKLAVIAVIYFSLFAAYDHRPDDTANHLLGVQADRVLADRTTSTNQGP